MPSFLSICLTLLRIAIRTTNIVQGLLIDLHNAVEWLRERQNSSITPSAEDQSSNKFLTEPSSSDTIHADQVAPSRSSTVSEALQSAGPLDFPEISSTRKVFVGLNRLLESENNSEPIIIPVRNEAADLERSPAFEDQHRTFSATTDANATKDNHSSKLQGHEMMLKWFPNEPSVSKSTTNEDSSILDEPTEIVPLNMPLNSETAGDNYDVEETSDKPVINPSPKQVETKPSEILRSLIYSMSNVVDSRTCETSKESNYVSLEITALPEGTECEPRLSSKKSAFDIDLKLERNLHLIDYDTSTLREKGSKDKSPIRNFSNEKPMANQDIDIMNNLKETHLPVKPSKRTGRTPVKTKDDNSTVPAALYQSLSLPRFCVDHSTGNVHWKTDISRDSTSEPKGSSPYKKNSKHPTASDNKQKIECELRETSTTEEEIQYKPIRDRVPTPPPIHMAFFPIAESSTDNEQIEDTRAKSYPEQTDAQSKFKPVSQRRPTPAARFPTRPSSDTDEDKGAKYDPIPTSRHESPTIAEVEFKSTRERRPTPPPRFVHHDPTSSSGTESGIFSEPNNLTIFVPLQAEARPPAFRSPLKSHDNSHNESVRFIDQPLLTKNDRIDSIEKIEFVIQPTCEFIPPEAIIYPKTVSQISTPLSTDSDTPENIRYIEKSCQLLIAVSTECNKEQEFCDNSSATEFPVSGSPTNSTDSEGAFENKQLPIKSLSSTENDKSPSKECKTPFSVRFQLPESRIERESKGIRRDSKFRKPPNETSTSEEENDTKLSKKRRASPGKFYKSPKKFAEATASKIRGYKFSPQKTSIEKKHEDKLSMENTSATRSLDFELGIQQKSGNEDNLPTSADQMNLKTVLKEHICTKIFEEKVIEKANFHQVTLKSDSVDDTSSTTDSISETTSSARIGENLVEDSAPEGTELFSQHRTNFPLAVAGSMVDSDEQENDSAPEGTKGLFLRSAKETLAIQENVFYRDSNGDSSSKKDAANNSSVKDSTDSDTSRKISTAGHFEVLDTNETSSESKTLQIEELVGNQTNEGRIYEGKKTPQLESTLTLQSVSKGEQKSSFNLQLEATNSASNDDSSKRSSTSSESSSSEYSVNEKTGSESSNEGAPGLSSQLNNRTELEKYSNADKNEDRNSTESKSESPKFLTTDKSTNLEFVKNSTHEADTDNFIPQNIAHQINTVVYIDGQVEIDTTFDTKTSAENDEHTELKEASSNTLHPATVDSLSKDDILETKRSLEVQISSFNDASISSNRISVLSPVYEVSANGTTSSGSYSESETANGTSEEEEKFILEQGSPLSESPPSLSPKNGHSSSELEMMVFSTSRQMSTSRGEHIPPFTTSLEPAVQSPSIDKRTGVFNSVTETVSSLSSPSKSSNSEVDEENTIDHRLLSRLNTNEKKDHTSKTYFSPVLEELVQRFKSTTRINSETVTSPRRPSNSEVEDEAEVTSHTQLCAAFTTNVNTVYNAKSFFNPVLKELVQRVKSTTVSDSITSISNVTNTESLSTYSKNAHVSEDSIKNSKDSNNSLTNPEESTVPRIDENSNANNGSDFLKHTDSVIKQTDICETEENFNQLVCVESCVVDAESIKNLDTETLQFSCDLSTENTYFEVQDSTENNIITCKSTLDHVSCMVPNNITTCNKDVSNLIVCAVSKSNLFSETLVSDSSKPLTSTSMEDENSESVSSFSIKSDFLICSTSIAETSKSNECSNSNPINLESSVKDVFEEEKCEDTTPKCMIVNLTSVETFGKEVVESDENHELIKNEVLNVPHGIIDSLNLFKRSVCENKSEGIFGDNSVPKIKVPTKTFTQTSLRQDFIEVKKISTLELSHDSKPEEKGPELNKCVDAVHSDNLVTGSENIKQENFEFELHIAPQPIPCEIIIESRVEVSISDETSADKNEIRIVDSKSPVNALSYPDLSTAESTTRQPIADVEKDDSNSRCLVAAVSNEPTTVETSPQTETLYSSMSSTAEDLVVVESALLTSSILVETAKDYFIENIVDEVFKDDPTESTHVETKNSSTENAFVEVAKVDDSNENIFVEMTKGDDSTENAFVDVMQDISESNNAVNTSTNLDSSSFAEEGNADDMEESAKENKAWKKKPRKSKKKRRN